MYRTRFFSTSTIRYLNMVLIIVIRKEPMANLCTCGAHVRGQGTCLYIS